MTDISFWIQGVVLFSIGLWPLILVVTATAIRSVRARLATSAPRTAARTAAIHPTMRHQPAATYA